MYEKVTKLDTTASRIPSSSLIIKEQIYIYIFFFLGGGTEQITALGTEKRNHPTKDKRQRTKDRKKDWCSNQRTQRWAQHKGQRPAS
jgi:hypothetical protein